MLDPSVADRMEGGPRRATGRSTGRRWCGPPCGPSATPRPPRWCGSLPRLRATPTSPEDAWRELEQRTAYSRPYGALHPLLVAAETAHLAVMTPGLAVAPLAAAAALVTWSAQPALVFAGRPPALRPPGVAHGSLGRLPRAWSANARIVLAGRRATRARDARRRANAAARAPGPRDPVRAPAQHLLLVRVGRPRRAARRHRPAPAQARHLPPRRVPGLRPRVPEPGADRGRPRPLLRRRLRRPGRGAGRDQLRRAGQDLPQPGGGAGPLHRAAGLARRGHRPRPLPAGGPAALARGHLRRAGHERLGHRGRPPGPGRHRLPGHVPGPGRHAAPVLRRGQHAPLPGAHPGPQAASWRPRPRWSSRAAT